MKLVKLIDKSNNSFQIINIEAIIRVQKKCNESLIITMNTGEKIELPDNRRYIDSFEEILQSYTIGVFESY